jgi:hypothetical protein
MAKTLAETLTACGCDPAEHKPALDHLSQNPAVKRFHELVKKGDPASAAEGDKIAKMCVVTLLHFFEAAHEGNKAHGTKDSHIVKLALEHLPHILK